MTISRPGEYGHSKNRKVMIISLPFRRVHGKNDAAPGFHGRIVSTNPRALVISRPAKQQPKDSTMSDITIEHNPSTSRLNALGVSSWPTWSKEVSVFPWSYGETEVAYVLEGEVVVTPKGGEPVTFGKGDLVTFPSGMSCTWEVKKPLRKHYRFG
jgi:uncharacterized cupin superfamily protein